MTRVGLLVIERINAITLKRIALLDELRRREKQPAHPRIGAWRHEYNLEGLRLRIALLEKRRMALLAHYKPEPD